MMTLHPLRLFALSCSTLIVSSFVLLGQGDKPEPDISVILDSDTPTSPSRPVREVMPEEATTATTVTTTTTTTAPLPTPEPPKPLRILNPVPLNSFALVMAQKANMTFVPNPHVSGNVLGTFVNTDPLAMLEQAARANGYQMSIRKGVIELENGDTRAALPIVAYTRVLRYLRAPYVRDPGTREASVATTGTISDPTGGGGGGSSSGGSGNTGGSGGGTGGGNPSSVPGSQSQRLTELFRGVLSKDAYINFDQKTSTLVARDIDVNIAALDALINELDVEKPDILTAVTAYEVNSDPSSYRGVDWSNALGAAGTTVSADIARTLIDAFTGHINVTSMLGGPLQANNQFPAQTPTPPAIGTATATSVPYVATAPVFIFNPPQVSAVVRFLNSRSLVESKAHWFTVSEDNESSVANIGIQQPIVSVSGTTANTSGSVQFDYVNVGAILRVTPQLRPGNIVRLQIRPELSDIPSFVTVTGAAAGGSTAPIINTRSTEMVVSMPLGKSLVLGGLQNLMNSETANKIPFLGDIPLLGPAIFSNKTKTSTNRNLVLLVEPRIINYNSIPEFEKAVKREADVFKWKKEYGAASPQNIDSTVKEWGFGVGEGRKDGEQLTPISKPLKENP